MKMRTWLSTIASTTAFGGFALAQVPPSGSTAALAAQTSNIHPANDKPVFTMRTAGQPDRAVRVLKMGDPSENDPVAEVQDVQTGRTFTMPGKVVKAMLAGVKPTMPAAAPVAPVALASHTVTEPIPTFQQAPMQIIPATKPNPPAGAPVFQPNRIASSIYERPAMAPEPVRRPMPTITAVQAVIPNPTSPPAAMPRVDAVPEPEKFPFPIEQPEPQREPEKRVVEAPKEIPQTVVSSVKIASQPEPEKPVLEAPKEAPPTTLPIAKPTLQPVPEKPVVETPREIPPAVVAIAKIATTPEVAPAPAKATTPVEPAFGTRLQPIPGGPGIQPKPPQVWQPIVPPGSQQPVNGSIWQPLAPAAQPGEKKAEPQSKGATAEPKTTVVTTACSFDGKPCPVEPTEQQLKPQVIVERPVSEEAAQIETDVRDACQATIYDLSTAVKPVLREEAATKLCESRYASRPEVKAAILKAAIADPAPSVRAHCIECLMKMGHCEASYLSHLRGVAADGPKIVQTAAKAALDQAKPE